MIKHLRHTEINKSKWDNTIKLSPEGIVYAASWYLDIVSPGWEALMDDDYKFIFPLCNRSKFGFSYLYQPHFTQQGGLFSISGFPSTNKVKQFLDAIPEKYKLIEINLNTSNHIDAFNTGKVSKRRTHHLSLRKPIEELRKNYSDNLKRNLKKSKQVEQIIESAKEVKEIIALFRSERGKNIEQLGDKEYTILERLISIAQKRNEVEILLTRNSSGKITAGAVFLKSFTSYIFLFSATGNEARESGSMSLIIDHFIEKHQQENKLLDFEGSMNDDLSRFYKSYGSQEIVYLQIRKNTLPIPIRWFK